MQFSIANLAVLFAATASAAEVVSRQATLAQFVTYPTSGCQGSPSNTIPIRVTSLCQQFSAGVVSGKVLNRLPAGCSITFYDNTSCDSVGTINVPRDIPEPQQCFEFGLPRNIRSARISGTCGSPAE